MVPRWSAVNTTIPEGISTVVEADGYVKDPDHGWYYGHAVQYSDDQFAQLQLMMVEHKRSFAYTTMDLPGYSGKHGGATVELTHENAIFSQSRNRSPLEVEIQQEKCAELADAHIIVPCPHHSNKYAACATMPAKKDSEGNWVERRFCVDFRRLNDATAADMYKLHLPEELFQRVRGATIFTKLDLRAGFHQNSHCPS